MLKLFVSDIDGTLMNARKEITEEDVQAIKEASRLGVAICLASGRMYEEITKVMEVLDTACYAVCQNGATIIGLDGEVLRSNVFASELALSLQAATKLPGFVPVICSSDCNYVLHATEHTERVGRRFLTPLQENPQLVDEIQNGLAVTKFSIYGEIPDLEALLKQLQEQYGDQITASFSDPDGIDVMPNGVDKGAGIRLLMEHIGVSADGVACIGDSFNDLAMFRACEQSFAMSHSPQAIREEAAFVADTVGSAIKRLL
ncbi:HAD family hydrolase [Paenibacillus albus]|nr:HAD family hydrolase [Paenibacillus albus]